MKTRIISGIVMGVIVGTLVLAMYMPMISMYGGMENM